MKGIFHLNKLLLIDLFTIELDVLRKNDKMLYSVHESMNIANTKHFSNSIKRFMLSAKIFSHNAKCTIH